MVQRKVGNKLIRLVKGDVTLQETDAFVFDITEDAKLGSGYGGAIMQRGGKVIQDELTAIGSCKTGEAIVTTAGELKAKHIIHVNGPKFHEPDTENKLRRATKAALARADEKGAKSIAFPPIGTGMYQVPMDLCARVMVETVEQHLKGKTSLEDVCFVAADPRELGPFKAQIAGGA